MRGTTHQAVSALAGLTYCHATTPTLQQGAATTIALIGAARLPDQLEFRYFLNGVRRRGWAEWCIPHRGPTHWLITGALVSALAWLLSACIVDTHPYALHVALGVLAGYWLHVVFDAPNEMPVQAWPRRWTHFGWPEALRFRSGGFVDSLLAMVCVGLCVWLAVGLLPEGPLIEAGGR